MSERLDENGVGMLVISPDHEVQFADDIEVVYVVPPVLDKINKWLRDTPMTVEDAPTPEGPEAAETPAPAAEQAPEDETPGWAMP